jgi:hypothetical protein
VLLPALGEIIRTADESMEITRLCYGKQSLKNQLMKLFGMNQLLNDHNTYSFETVLG